MNEAKITVGETIARSDETVGATLRALLVDDSERTRRHLAKILRTWGFDCVEAQDGIDAVRLASECGIDLVITDIEMPRLDGWELLSLIRRGVFGDNPPPVIVCSSGFGGNARTGRPELQFCAALIPKLPSVSELAAAVSAAFPDRDD